MNVYENETTLPAKNFNLPEKIFKFKKNLINVSL
jgi:hypothetical protein